MKDPLMTFMSGAIIGMLIMAVIHAYFIDPIYTAPYKQGQVDAYNNKYHWVLKQQPDGSISWQFIKEVSK